MADVEFHMESNKKEILSALESQIQAALEDCGLDAESFAKQNITSQKAVDTGNLLNSITHKVEGEGAETVMHVGTAVEYAPYVEYGTGIYAAGGRQTPWVYKGADGKFYRTRGMKARKFIKPAISEHITHYKRVIQEHLES